MKLYREMALADWEMEVGGQTANRDWAFFFFFFFFLC